MQQSRYQRLLAVAGLLVALAGCGVTAPRGNEGYADLQSPGIFDTDITLSLSLGPSLLRFAASLVEDDPAARALLQDLDGVRVRIYEIEGDADRVSARLQAMHATLRQQHWESVVAVREAGECTYVMLKPGADGDIAGLTVLDSDGTEVVIVNVMGTLRPESFSTAMGAIDVDVAAITRVAY